MRLLKLEDNGDFCLTEPLLNDEKPPYAILSHTWGCNSEEVTFEDLDKGGPCLDKAGYDKIKFCGEQAARDHLKYFWVDSCCIKKSSDAELSEAINSMFRWYHRADRCYVYMSDVSKKVSQSQWESAFRNSRWFKRGWTLQELIAPSIVQFFSKEGELLGDKESLKQQIYEITGIPFTALNGCPLSSFSVEARMQWAAARETTRKEDGAYCLLGIFNVFIPPIYGEGGHAFVRLREAINNGSKEGVDSGTIDVSNMASDRTLPLTDLLSGLRRSNTKKKRTQKNRDELLKSLVFNHIENRYNTIKIAHSETCQWLLTNGKYLAWKDKAQVLDHHGILWLKGKPGAGKSTIVKFALTEAKRSGTDDIHISFFFNARGSLLEKDTRGMYQSLLFQLLAKLPRGQEVFDKFDLLELPLPPSYSWTIMQLKMVLNCAVDELGKHSLWIYVDALDECDEDQIRDMVAFFAFLGKHAVTSQINLRVFFASRYYPKIRISKKVELRLDDEEEHSRDIERYIQSELTTGHDMESEVIERIRKEVKRRASGVFIWVVLVVQILNKANDHGQISSLEKRLQEIPVDLGQLFREIISRDGHNMESMRLCIQWILFAKRPLTREELYFAIYSGIDPEDVGSWRSENITTGVMDAFILSSSKGLAEFTNAKNATVQFIHETIRDFLLKENGMQYIQGISTQSLVGCGHDSLKRCCLNYVSSAQKSLSISPPVNINSLRTVDIHRQTAPTSPPFIEYAQSHIIYHANAAQANDISQVSFLKEFSVQDWTRLNRVFSKPRAARFMDPQPDPIGRYPPELSLLTILALENAPSLITTMLEMDPQAEIEGSIHDSPLRTALEYMHYDALGALLTPSQARNTVSQPASPLCPPNESELGDLIQTYYFNSNQGRSAEPLLHQYFNWGYKTNIAVLLRSGRFTTDANISTELQCSPLTVAAERGYEDVVKIILDQQGADPNVQDYLGLTPLSRAIRESRLNLVSLLVQSTQIDINLQCSAGRSPLSYAAEKGHEDILKLVFCHPDVEVNSRDKKGRTPFFYAAMCGHEGIIKLLIESNVVDLISRNSIGHTALSYAAMNGHEGVVRQLLGTCQVDVNSRDTIHGRTPLLFALEYGYKTIATLLLREPDIDFHLANNRGRTPLDFARDKQMHEAMQTISQRTLEAREEVSGEDSSDSQSFMSSASRFSDDDTE